MNGSSCSRLSFDFSGRFLPPAYILVFTVGFVANALGLKFLLQNWRKVGPVNVFFLNLGLADLLYLLTLPFLVVYHFMEHRWIFGDTFCKVTRFCFNINLYGSIGFLTCISVFRYLSIVHPMETRGRLTSTHSGLLSLVVWLSVSGLSLPDMFFPKAQANRTLQCFSTTSDALLEEYLEYSVGWTVAGFCLPFLLTVGCYSHVFVTLCSSSNLQLKQRSYRLLLLVLLLLFSVCYIPYHVFRNLNLWSRVLSRRGQCHGWFNVVYVSKQVSRGLACLNSALNPLVYLNVSEEVGSKLRTLLSRAKLCLRRRSLSPAHEPDEQRPQGDIY